MTTILVNPPLDARQSTLSDLEPLELAYSHMPRWLLGASTDAIAALNAAMAQSRYWHGRVGRKFSEVQSVEAYCGRLLAAEVLYEFGPSLDVYRDYLDVVHVHLITDETLLLSVRNYLVRDEPKTLLWAALQNFSEDEAQPGGFNPQSKILYGGHHARISPIRPYEFAALCRRLDLGLKYQTYLQDMLDVALPGTLQKSAAQLATEADLRQLKTFDMQVDAHIALLKKNITATACRALLELLTPAAAEQASTAVLLDGKPVFHSALAILDTRLDGVVVFSAQALLLHPAQRVIAYIPNDPVAPFFEFGSLQMFIDELKHRLRDPAYARFFSRFVALSARAVFMQKVIAHPEVLFLTATPLGMSAANYLTTVQLRNMFADAQIFAVPTRVVDEQAREARWQQYKQAGLLLINVAALFIPVLGDLMLAVAIGEMLKEVYEGVEDWSQGDVDHAREHLLNVARDVAVNVSVAVGVGLVSHAARRLSLATLRHFEGFEPIMRDDGSARLWSRQLEHYEQPAASSLRHLANPQGVFSHLGAQYVEVDGKCFRIEFDGALKQWRIVHPARSTAFRPALLHNRQGAWQHAHERPLEWEGSATLLGRLGGAAATFDELALERIRMLTDTPPGLMRRVHLESLAPPPLLNLSLKRFEIDRQLSTFIQQMSGTDYGAARWADMQLQLLTPLPGWPVGKGLAVVDSTGQSLRHYDNPSWPTMSRINLTTAILEQGKLLDAVVTALPHAQSVALLGAETVSAQKLAQVLGAYVRDNRALVFDRLYAGFDISTSLLSVPIERAFQGLPHSLAQALVDTATAHQLDVLRAHKVPIELAEKARFYLREARINRALEGFYLAPSASEDTEQLALHFLGQIPGLPYRYGLEIHEDSLLGTVMYRWGNVETWGTRVLVKTAQGYVRYRPRGATHVREPGAPLPLLAALFESLTPAEHQAMGLASGPDVESFSATLAALAANERDETARVLGMQPIKPLFKPPVTLLDGRTGYPLCGLGAGSHSRALQRRVRAIYPDFDDDQVENYLDVLIDRGLEPLHILRERKRERKALMTSLQDWIDATPNETSGQDALYDYADNRYQVAGLIERSWRKSPTHIPWANPDELYSLSLDGFRIGNLPELPAVADFSHVKELKLSNMDCGDRANDFLEHFNRLVSLEMDNNRMVSLPPQLERMPELRRLSLARNRLYLDAGNAALLNSLSKLEVLNLNDNLLGPQLNLSGLGSLRRVYLRRTWIEQWPPGLISRPLLESADLRENRLTDIPEQLYLAAPTITRNISLTGNPLSASARLRLARHAMQGGSSMGISNEALMSEAAAFEFWTAGIASQELRRRELLWNSLRADPSSDDFFAVISRLTATADAQSVRQDLSRRVWEMIEAANDDGALRRDVLNVAASPRSCSDSVAFTFSVMEVQVELAAVSRDVSLQVGGLLGMARRQFRLQKLTEIASAQYAQRLELGQAADELEIHLAYHIGLARALDLPGQPKHMVFSRLAGVTEQDLEQARIVVANAEQTPALNVFISTQQYWKDYLIRTHKAEYNTLMTAFYSALAGLLRDSPQMSDERYLRRVTEIRNEMDVAVDAWSLGKTDALLAAHSSQASPSTAL